MVTITKTKNNIKDLKLFQIGEASQIVGVTRRMILNYEECGLIKPVLKDEKTSYRYYSADNLTQLQLIRSLQNCGLSLSEIRMYLNNTLQLTDTIERLESIRDQLDKSITKLRVRTEKSFLPNVYWTILPEQTYYYKKMEGSNLSERTSELRDAYIEAVRKYKLDRKAYMFTEVTLDKSQEYFMAIPVEEKSEGENINKIPEMRALCIYYRGCYENMPQAVKSLVEYINEKNFQTKGKSRSIYLEGPPNRGTDKDNYITQIAIPVEDEFEDIPRV